MLDLSGPLQAFLAAGQALPDYTIGHCSFQTDIGDSSGLHFSKLDHYTKVRLREGDYLFVPGFSKRLLSEQGFQKEWEGVYDWLRNLSASGVKVCSVCSGAFILARAGLLSGKRCTTHWSVIPMLREEFPDIRIEEDALFIREGNIYTSAGISSGIDLALYILEEEQGPLFAHKIARELVVYFRRSNSHSQDSVYLNYRNHLHRGIHQLQDWLIENLDRRVTIEQMAEIVNMSSRNLTRTFKIQTGISINEYVTLLRLELARNLQHSPGITIRDIAGRCGFSNERQLQRIRKQAVSGTYL